ncbi:MAG: ImmA/IrrE family metallo-endopeptidase [Oscillospiraceae bacterium]|nr:ImmA/IrrE family metallo-endopeptidase [Oscillospiraceae bacterium]
MSYYIGKNSARYTLQGAVTLLKSYGIYIHFDDKIVYKGVEKTHGLTQCCCNGYKYIFDVAINSNLPIEEQKLTLSHEMAHIVLGHLVGNKIESDYNISLEQQEFEAEALGLMICNFLFGFNSEQKVSV